MRKTFFQCCIALLLAPVLTFMLIGTVALAASADGGTGSSSSTGGGTGSSGGGTGSGGGTTTPPVTPPAPTLQELKVSLSGPTGTMALGDEATLKATVTPTWSDGGTALPSGITYKWECNPNSAATITGTGAEVMLTVTSRPLDSEIKVKVTASYNENSKLISGSAEHTIQVGGISLSPNGAINIAPGQYSGEIKATATPSSVKVQWVSQDTTVATVSQGIVYGVAPGETEVYAFFENNGSRVESSHIKVSVNGIKLEFDSMELEEDESKPLPEVERFGSLSGTVGWQTLDPDVAEVVGSQVVGRSPGRTTLLATIGGGLYEQRLTVTVSAGTRTIDLRDRDFKLTDTLNFGTIHSQIAAQAGGKFKVSHVSNLYVPTSQGTLYYNYYSEAEPGEGVARSGSYYLDASGNNRSIDNVTFVPKPYFTGGTVTITYTAVSEDYQNYSCRIYLNVKPESGTDASIVSLTTSYNTAVKLDAYELDRVCQERNGVSLSSVTFLQPSPREGTLYTNYNSASDYGSVVSTDRSYSRRELEDIYFVPAPGFTGTVTVYYTARGSGSSSNTAYAGQILVNVQKAGSVSVGGPVYNTANGNPVRFDDADFDDYRRDAMSGGGDTLSYIQFDALPSASEGILYYDYNSASGYGSVVAAGTAYRYGANTPRLDRITFVPDASFVGTVRIPFTGWDRKNVRFSGDVVINVRGGSGSGDIHYTCAPGRTVSFVNSDFTDLSRELTGRTLDYIIIESLPDQNTEGYLTHNGTRVTTATRRYYNNSGSYRVSRLAFRAAGSFSGTVDIPFVGYSTNGDSFDGVITISSNGVNDWTIRYNTDSSSAAVFDREDFDALSQWETDQDISSVRFSIPSVNQGDLYRNYRSASSKGTRISSSTSISRSTLNQVAFVPAKGFTGTVTIEFTGSAGGRTFTGTVEIVVERADADATARYSTRTAPVSLYSEDLRRSGYTLTSVRFTAMPSSEAGHLYYQYSGPFQRGSLASTGTVYRVSGSSLISELTFVPRAGYSGTVILPYTGTNSNGSTFDGEVIITVSPTYNSSYFNDMGSYSESQKAAVDYLREKGITNGVSASQYGPESSIRRGDFATMIYRAFDLTSTSAGTSFYDVPDSAYYAQAVRALSARGIVNGVGGGYFNPEGTLSRQDAVCMIQRAMRAVGMSVYDGSASSLYGYGDGGRVSDYAQGAMAFAVQNGYLPTSGGRLDATQPLTRVDMAQMLHRVLTY